VTEPPRLQGAFGSRKLSGKPYAHDDNEVQPLTLLQAKPRQTSSPPITTRPTKKHNLKVSG
jgi:hypothetical protein